MFLRRNPAPDSWIPAEWRGTFRRSTRRPWRSTDGSVPFTAARFLTSTPMIRSASSSRRFSPIALATPSPVEPTRRSRLAIRTGPPCGTRPRSTSRRPGRHLAGAEGAPYPGGAAGRHRAARITIAGFPRRHARPEGAGLARRHPGHRPQDQRGRAVVLDLAQSGAARRRAIITGSPSARVSLSLA